MVAHAETREMTVPELAVDLNEKFDSLKSFVSDMDSRVQEIEHFRNTASIEGKLRNLHSELESLNTTLGQLRAEMTGKFKEYDKTIESLKKIPKHNKSPEKAV